MKCKDCSACHKGYFKSKPDAYVCIGVPEPFVINNINNECTEYSERRNKKRITIEDAINHFKYGISRDIFSEPVTSYAKMAVESLEKQIPMKPIYVDIRFRNHSRNIADGSSLDKCYKCPNCLSHIFHVFDSEVHCKYCGQALDWD